MPTKHKLTLSSTGGLNTSMQVGDTAYKVNSGSFTSTNGVTYMNNVAPVKLGTIVDIQGLSIFIEDMVGAALQNDVIMFAKNIAVNKSGMKGYFAEVTLLNDSPKRVELFSIASEVTPSSK